MGQCCGRNILNQILKLHRRYNGYSAPILFNIVIGLSPLHSIIQKFDQIQFGSESQLSVRFERHVYVYIVLMPCGYYQNLHRRVRLVTRCHLHYLIYM